MISRKFIYFILALGLMLIIAGGFSSFLAGLKKDRELVVRRMDDVSADYETFDTSVSLFGDYREDFHDSILENLYYETMYNSDTLVKNEFIKYESMVDDISETVKALDALCRDVYYPEGNINSMCMNYPTIYEQVVNYFLVDVNEYNDIVKQYNQYQNSTNSSYYVKEYSTTKKYIDYNGDKVFEGKEE